ncbi:MAG: serine/threonine protein kinase [Planctomycetes bacterium]|nr:serine/threonine protein kinase [Planctomycetota bacterium]
MENTSDSGLHILPLPKVGQEVGRFLIEKELPRGGQARVYRAWQLDLQRPVALKLLPASFATDHDALTRFRREIENVAKVSHPNVVHVYEAGQIDGHAFFTMEFIEGEDAETAVRRGPMGPDQAAALIEAVARGVQQAHDAGIVHRDIKPGNIILRRDETPVLTDFGLAQDLSHSNALTQTGVSMGTPAYMSPEQARGERARVGKRSDVYGLGATLFTLLTGKRPVEGESAYALMVKVAESEGPRWPRQALEDVPADLRAIVERAMQNDPGRRYESAQDLADDLERFLRGDWVHARSRGRLSRLWSRARRFVPAAAVLLLAAGVAAGIVYTDLSTLAGNEPDPGATYYVEDLTRDVERTNDTEIDRLFGDEGSWVKANATVRRPQGDELQLTREGEGRILIAPRAAACWGDFTLQAQLSAAGTTGPVNLLVGSPEDHNPDDTAYTIALGDGAAHQFVLRRLGVPVFSGLRGDGLPLLEDGRWYNFAITRRAQALAFALTDLATTTVVASFEYEDDFPALVGETRAGVRIERQRFGISADCDRLGVRNVTVSHRDHRHAAEELLFAVGQYAEAGARAAARLSSAPAAPTPESRAERARLHFLRGRCHLALGRPEAAAADLAQARDMADDPVLRARVLVRLAALETARERDEAALAQLRAARLISGPAHQARVFHAAIQSARAVAAEPQRALLYYDYVAGNALVAPHLVAEALLESAGLRLAAADPASLAQARQSLRRLATAGYRRHGGVFVPAVVLLFEQRWAELLAGATAPANEPPAAPELTELAELLAAAAGGYGVDNERLVRPLARASWLARLSMGPADTAALESASDWLAVCAAATADPSARLWARALQILAREEHPQLSPGGLAARKELWAAFARALPSDDPAYGALSALADFFLVDAPNPAEAQRRADLFRHTLKRELATVPRHWLADAEPDRFAEFCVGLYFLGFDRPKARSLIEGAATGRCGALGLLKGRVEQWLPPERE